MNQKGVNNYEENLSNIVLTDTGSKVQERLKGV